ncbi:glycosyltransferase family 2 protein [Helicobacter cinaedi]|uniref:glycosyltransferase family 2 protein n=1 Tax=Helicobacter cinaedi TaxID=213 RepID=UPI001FB1E534|nr:glycosyltransferase family A protein [Helicobacter cinaedi]
MPKVSVLIPSFNHEKFVGFFIESVLKQSFEDFELIIVDGCSSDNNVNEILKLKDPRIKLIQHPYNQGINAGLNTAFENANGEYLVFCASDNVLAPNALEVIYKAFSENPSVKAIYPRLVRIDANGVKIRRNLGNLKIKLEQNISIISL